MESRDLPSESQFLHVDEHDGQWTFATSDAELLDLTAALLEPYGELMTPSSLHKIEWFPSENYDSEVYDAMIAALRSDDRLSVELSEKTNKVTLSCGDLSPLEFAMKCLCDQGEMRYECVMVGPPEGCFWFTPRDSFSEMVNTDDAAFANDREEYLNHFSRFIDYAAQSLSQAAKGKLIDLRIALWGYVTQPGTIEKFMEMLTKGQEILPYVRQAHEAIVSRSELPKSEVPDDGQPIIEHTKPTMWARWFGDSGNDTDVDKENQNNHQPG